MEWPWLYDFPPFFTLQPHLETRQKQLSVWKQLILDYHRYHKKYTFEINQALSSRLFNNRTINRKLNYDTVVMLMNELSKSKNALIVDNNNDGCLMCEIYWYTIEEWGQLLYDFVREFGYVNKVCTFYELTESDDVQNREFFKMDERILIKVLKYLENNNRCELIIFGDNKGVKFF